MKFKTIYLIFLIAIASCSTSPYTQEQIDLKVKENKNELLFLSFYPNMESDLFDAVLKTEVSRGKIKMVKNEYGNSKRPRYSIHTKNENLSFAFGQESNGIYLIFHENFTREQGSRPSQWDADAEQRKYDSRFKSLLDLYQGKYGNYVQTEDSDGHWSYRFSGHGKVIYMYEESKTSSRYGNGSSVENHYKWGEQLIRMNYYSTKSHQLEKAKLKMDAIEQIQIDKEEKQRERQQEQKEKDNRENSI